MPLNKGYAQVQWRYDGWEWINTFNYVGDYKDFGADVSRQLAPSDGDGRLPDPANIEFTRNRRVKAYLTFDTQLSYTFRAQRAETGAAGSTTPRSASG